MLRPLRKKGKTGVMNHTLAVWPSRDWSAFCFILVLAPNGTRKKTFVLL